MKHVAFLQKLREEVDILELIDLRSRRNILLQTLVKGGQSLRIAVHIILVSLITYRVGIKQNGNIARLHKRERHING